MTLIYNAKLLDETLESKGAVLLAEGKISEVFLGDFSTKKRAEKLIEKDAECELFDAKGLTLTPAFIDMHVHLRYPGLTAKEDLNSGLHAAAAGGFGTVVAMPNTKPVVSSYELARSIEKEADQIGLTKLYQTVSITKDFEGTDVSHLNEVEKEFVPVITEDGHDVLSTSVMFDGMKIAAEKGLIVSCHSEAPTLAEKARPFRQAALKLMKENGLSAWGADTEALAKVPAEVVAEIDANFTKANNFLALAEDTATYRNIQIAELAGCHIHIAHCSTKKSLEIVRQAKKSKIKVTCEVSPHHIALSGTEEPNIRALVNPPLRSEEDRLACIQAIKDGTADVISTDHAPHTLEDKVAGAPGFTGIETSYGVCNTVLCVQNGVTEHQLSKCMSAEPARILGLNKGLLKTGYDADLTLVDPTEKWIVDSSKFYSKGKASPFNGQELTGKVHGLFISGKKIF